MFNIGVITLLLSFSITYGYETLNRDELLQKVVDLLKYVVGKGSTSDHLCPDSWIRFEDSCYLFPHGNVTFSQAVSSCVQQESYLVHIETEAENIFLRKHLKALKDSDYWTGLKRGSSGKWIWYGTETEASFTDWSKHSPNNYGGNQNCIGLELAFNFQWNDLACSSQFHAICERKVGQK